MNHEKNEYRRLPTANVLFHEVGKLAILKGDVNDVQNEKEEFRKFTIDHFPQAIQQRWPKLRSIAYFPANPVDGPPQDDMAWVIISDDIIRRDFIISRTADDRYDVEVEDTFIGNSLLSSLSSEDVLVADADADDTLDDRSVSDAIDVRYELTPRSHVPSTAELLLLGRMIDELSIAYDIDAQY